MKTILFLLLVGSLAACATSAADPVPNHTSTPPAGDVSPTLPPSSPGAPPAPAKQPAPEPAPAGDPGKGASCNSGYPKQYIHCDGTSNVRALSTAIYPTDRVSTYACAAGEVAHETALELDPPAGAAVSVNLVVTDAADADLDLIVLDNLCYGQAACMNSGTDGLTLGTGTESVTFTAQAGHKYFVVVDGKVATPANFEVSVSCN